MPTMIQGMDLAILLSQFGKSNDELWLNHKSFSMQREIERQTVMGIVGVY